jgi:uncharacterized membrane protein (DUF485 family)
MSFNGSCANGGMLVFGVNRQTAPVAAIIGIGVLLLTYILIKVYLRLRPAMPELRKLPA